jgi:hypothetical protein
MAALNARATQTSGSYGAKDFAGLNYSSARMPEGERW